MKQMIFAIIVCLLLGCNSNPVDISKLSASFGIADTVGNTTNVFHQGEAFDLSLAVTNESGADQTYHYTGVPVVFQITRGDSVISTSVDGYVFAQVVLAGQIANGKTYSAQWRAPNTDARNPKLILPVGEYQAKVLHGDFFDKYTLAPSAPIVFNVVR